jgi:hypothetical protein
VIDFRWRSLLLNLLRRDNSQSVGDISSQLLQSTARFQKSQIANPYACFPKAIYCDGQSKG